MSRMKTEWTSEAIARQRTIAEAHAKKGWSVQPDEVGPYAMLAALDEIERLHKESWLRRLIRVRR